MTVTHNPVAAAPSDLSKGMRRNWLKGILRTLERKGKRKAKSRILRAIRSPPPPGFSGKCGYSLSYFHSRLVCSFWFAWEFAPKQGAYMG